jgi:peptide/nickel transport system permease protein
MLVLLSVPTFLVAYALVSLASSTFGCPSLVAPLTESSAIAAFGRLAMPSIAIAVGAIAFLSRYVRSQVIEYSAKPFAEMARLRGIDERTVLYHHVLRAGLLPIITLFGLYLPWIISGSVAVELIFGWPGVGTLGYEAFLQRDYPVVLTVNLVVAVAVLFASAITDILYRIADPRVAQRIQA